MTLTIELTPEEAARLRALAEARGTDESGAVRGLLGDLPPEKPTTGAALVEALLRIEEPSVYARFPEDASVIARRLRQEAEQRSWKTA
jgi:hypothetical protein